MMACIFCKSKFHDYRSCPMSYKVAKRAEIKESFKQDYFGQAPNIFIGRHGYPHIRVGILGTEQYDKHDDPKAWTAEQTPIPKIVALRSSLVNSFFNTTIKSFNDRFADVAKEVSLAKRPVDVEIGLEKRPAFRLTFNTDVQPHGPNVALKQAKITENVPVDTRVDKAASANDLLAGDAITTLAKKGIDEHFLTKAFSMGNFGIPIERKLVPTRWSITAVDDILGKQKIDEIKRYAESDCIAYFGGHYGNYYLILFFDEKWSYELFEQYWPTGGTDMPAETDHEPYEGRKDYVHETAGGYYAARIGILEKLLEHKRQSSVLAIRIITEEYSAPLGVWVVREAVRKALSSEPMRFADRNLMKSYAQSFLKRKFSFDLSTILGRSRLVKELWGQKKLGEF
jgi:DNA repair protein NreA